MKKILLVEDEMVIAMDISGIIERFGYEVITAGRGDEAVQAATADGDVDLVLMDIDLGKGIDGTETARRILEKKNIPIVFLTSHSEREMVERVRGLTRYGYVIKNSGDFVLQSSIEMAFDLFEAHEKTKGKENELSAIYDNAPSVIMLLDVDFRIQRTNRYTTDYAGIAYSDIVGQHICPVVRCVYALESMDNYGLKPACEECSFHSVLRNTCQTGVSHENVESNIQLSVDKSNQNIYLIVSTKKLDIDGVPHLLVCFTDISKHKRAEVELARVNRALRMLSSSNHALMHVTEERTLLTEVCRIAVELGGYRMAWAGVVESDEAKTLRPVALAGFESGYADSANIPWTDDERSGGPAGISILTGQPWIARNILSDPAFAPWREAAIQRGYKSYISLPLLNDGRPLGTLSIYSVEADAFDLKELEILKEMAGDLGFGITTLRAHRHNRDVE